MALKLFEDEESGEEEISKIEIDEEYARRFEHNKKREDLQRYEELKKKGLIDEDSDDTDELDESDTDENDAEVVGSKSKDLEFLDALIKVRNQDPVLKNKDVKLFESDESEEEDEAGGEGNTESAKKKKPVYLKDVVAKHLIEEGPEFEEEEEDDEKKKSKKPKTYSEEQEELRKAFLDAVEEAEAEGGEGDLLTVKENNKERLEDCDSEEFTKKLDEYFGADAELDKNKLFLKEFFMKKLWMERDNKGNKAVVDKGELDDLERDEEEIERQEEYETNYRFEENAGDRVMGHSRKVEGSVRKKENARREQRKSKEERMKIAEMGRQEELKHLKNLKKKEIKERMKKVLTIAGFREGEECPFSAKDLEGEFNPEEYDQMMKSVFDEKYYDAEDSEFGSDGDEEKPDFGKEDELLGLPKNWDVIKSGDGFLAARDKTLKQKVNNEDDEREAHDSGSGSDLNSGDDKKHDEQPEVEAEESKRKRKRKASLVQRAKEALMEEYYKLDYEDTIGDLKTRFKYTKIKPNRYALSTEEILAMDDKELNQYVSLKKIAPYREKEWKVHNNKRRQLKMRSKDLLRGVKGGHRKDWKKKRARVEFEKSDQSRNDAENSAAASDDKGDGNANVGGDKATLSRRAKRRRRQSELKLPHSRLVAYGKISSDSKSKQKHRD